MEDVSGRRLVVREASRIIVLDARDRVLLFRALIPGRHDVWITPGGGVDPGETPQACAARELWEETGLRDVPMSACVWVRRHTFPWDDYAIEQRERFFVARVEAHDVVALNWTQEELTMLAEHRWWTRHEIAASDEWFAPRRLGELLAPIIAGELPDEPIETGV